MSQQGHYLFFHSIYKEKEGYKYLQNCTKGTRQLGLKRRRAKYISRKVPLPQI
jgi:hypothetical protein